MHPLQRPNQKKCTVLGTCSCHDASSLAIAYSPRAAASQPKACSSITLVCKLAATPPLAVQCLQPHLRFRPGMHCFQQSHLSPPPHHADPPIFRSVRTPPPPSAASPPPLLLLLHACCRRREPLFAAAPLTPPRRRTSALRRTPATAAVHRRSPPYQCSRLAAASSLRSSPHLRRVRTAPACILPLHLRSLLLQPPLATARRCTHAATRCCVSAPLRTSPPHGARLYPPYHRIPARRSTSACRRTPATAAAGSHTHTAVSPPHPCSRLAAAPSLAVASRLRTAHACGHLATAPGPLLAAAHMQQPRRHTMAAVSQQHLR